MSRPFWGVLLVATLVRVPVVVWAAFRFPPSEDGWFFHRLATRIAAGEGYTWLWDDGTVTFAAHYPVGYAGILAGLYSFLPAEGWVAMLLGAGFGILASGAAVLVCPRRPWLAGLVCALHPATLFYVPAVMTEGIAAACLVVVGWLLVRAEHATAFRILGALVMGGLVLLRPQFALLVPWFAILATPREAAAWRKGVWGAVLVALSMAVCLPWTLRNCRRMDRCALVSVNGGWNLLIGVQTESGAYAPLRVPDACREVWAEGAKDTCFEHAARQAIATHPLAWLGKIPRKLSTTFDYFGAAGWYLHSASPVYFPHAWKVRLGVGETIACRALLLLALFRLARRGGARRRLRWALFWAATPFAAGTHAWVAYAVLAILGLLDADRSPFVRWTSGVLLMTEVTHAVFFGAGRYGLVVALLVAILAVSDALRRPEAGTSRHHLSRA